MVGYIAIDNSWKYDNRYKPVLDSRGKMYRKLKKKYDYVTIINFQTGKVVTRKLNNLIN